jgi:hypothetical protein
MKKAMPATAPIANPMAKVSTITALIRNTDPQNGSQVNGVDNMLPKT